MSMFGNTLGSFNADVLNAKPDTDESKLRLIEEIKNRAKPCISARNFPEAKSLYSKAIEVYESLSTYSPDETSNALAILYANRSMCSLELSNFEESFEDAHKAILFDKNYCKAYFRKGRAALRNKKFIDGLQAVEDGLNVLKSAPNAAQEKEFNSLKNDLLKAKFEYEKNLSEFATKTPSTVTTTTPVASSTTSTSAPVKKNVEKKTDDVVIEDDEDLKCLRGYKKTSDGRTTSYFTHELDEETKNLIGNIAPKKIDEDPSIAIATSTSNGTSAWNTAGTFEERSFTPYVKSFFFEGLKDKVLVNHAKEQINQIINSQFSNNVVNISVLINDLLDFTGDASIIMNRGKKKYMCDVSVTLKFLVTVTCDANSNIPQMKIEGKIPLVDVTADEDYEFLAPVFTHYNEKDLGNSSSLPSETSLLLNEYIKSSNAHLKKEVVNVLKTFWSDFKKK